MPVSMRFGSHSETLLGDRAALPPKFLPRAVAYCVIGDQGSPVNNREKRPNPRVATLHCATV